MSGRAGNRLRSWLSSLTREKAMALPGVLVEELRRLLVKGPSRPRVVVARAEQDDDRVRSALYVRPRTGGPRKHPRRAWLAARRERLASGRRREFTAWGRPVER